MAQGLTTLGVFHNVTEAVMKLDTASDTILTKMRQCNGVDYSEEKVRIKGEEWCAEAVKIAVRAFSQPYYPSPFAPEDVCRKVVDRTSIC